MKFCVVKVPPVFPLIGSIPFMEMAHSQPRLSLVKLAEMYRDREVYESKIWFTRNTVTSDNKIAYRGFKLKKV